MLFSLGAIIISFSILSASTASFPENCDWSSGSADASCGLVVSGWTVFNTTQSRNGASRSSSGPRALGDYFLHATCTDDCVVQSQLYNHTGKICVNILMYLAADSSGLNVYIVMVNSPRPLRVFLFSPREEWSWQQKTFSIPKQVVEWKLVIVTSSNTGDFDTNIGALQISEGECRNIFDSDIIMPTKSGMMNAAVKPFSEALWHDATIPYQIDTNFTITDQAIIEEAVRDFQITTCIKFRPVSLGQDADYLYFFRESSRICASNVGRVGGKQEIRIHPMCLVRFGNLLHEMMHSLGFWHEHGRQDRDRYISINWNNVIWYAVDNFKKIHHSITSDLGFPYDYDSLMHYGRRHYSVKKGLDTIEPLEANAEIGQREWFSDTDILQIRALYECTRLEQNKRKIGENCMEDADCRGGFSVCQRRQYCGTGECRCEQGYALDKDDGRCKLPVNYGKTCNSYKNTCIPNGVCADKKCTCARGFTPKSQTCISIEATTLVRQQCERADQCVTGACWSGKCVCPDHQRLGEGNVCYTRQIGEECKIDDHCKHILLSICHRNTCSCRPGLAYRANVLLSRGGCVDPEATRPTVGQRCILPDQICSNGLTCYPCGNGTAMSGFCDRNLQNDQVTARPTRKTRLPWNRVRSTSTARSMGLWTLVFACYLGIVT